MLTAAQLCARWLFLCLPATLMLVYSSGCDPAFAAPKSALLTAAAALLLALSLAGKCGWKPAQEERRIVWLTALLACTTFLSAVLAQHRWQCVSSLLHTFSGMALAYATVQQLRMADGLRVWRRLTQITVLAAIAVALMALTECLASSDTSRMRIHATVGNPDFVATLLAATLPFALMLARTRGWQRVAWLSASAILTLATVLTGSRGGILALAAGLVTMALLALSRRRHRFALLTAVALLATLTLSTHWNARTPGESLRGRWLIWQVSLRTGGAATPLGSGPGTFAYAYPQRLGHFFQQPGHSAQLRFATHERHALNDSVEIWQETGWLGLAAGVALLAAWFRLALHKLAAAAEVTRPVILAALATVTALLSAALFDFPLHRAETWALFSISLAAPFLALPSQAIISQTIVNQTVRLPGRLWRLSVALLLACSGVAAAGTQLASACALAQGTRAEEDSQLPAAQAAYEHALRYQPASADAHFSLVRVLAEQERYDAALTQFQTSALYVNEPEFYLLRARILEAAGQQQAARQQTELALHQFPYSLALQAEFSKGSPARTATAPANADPLAPK